jgi:hypothetical protein
MRWRMPDVWLVEILISTEWKAMCRSDGKRYEFGSEMEAKQCAMMCYPDQLREHRLGGNEVVRTRKE